ncbi:Ig-like domain-containing protein [Methanobacterium sp. SMA-27]|uniref:Ig-like domain-containing protein n=1 Tax=Methanobacterium sp. SMA-27 TaxID=1495336 RepID=UPI00064E4A06|nr:Ig-like domain-containing protein [Methanobacterium sp. SMA-27]
MLLIFGVALILNVNTSAATTVGDNVTVDHSSPKVTDVSPAKKAVIKDTSNIQVKFNEKITAGNNLIYLKDGETKISIKKTYSGNTLTITPTNALASGVKYTVFLSRGSVSDLSGNKNVAFSYKFTVSPISVAQMKDGISRAEKFYASNGRLPNTVKYGSNLIPIAKFQKIIATQGLSIKKPKLVASTTSLASIMRAASKFSYSGAASTAEGMIAHGSGDCWAMSDYLYKRMNAAGMKSRILQYSTAYSSRHRSVQYFSNGSWQDAPYRTYFSTNMFNNTQSYGTVIACNV